MVVTEESMTLLKRRILWRKKQGILSKDAWKSNQVWAKHLQGHIA